MPLRISLPCGVTLRRSFMVKMYCGGICSWRLSPVARRPGRVARRRGTAHFATIRFRWATLIEVLRKRRPYDEGHRRLEKLLGVVYVAGWPARLWRWFPGATRVRLE